MFSVRKSLSLAVVVALLCVCVCVPARAKGATTDEYVAQRLKGAEQKKN